MSDRDCACPYCGEQTLTDSVGTTGRERAKALTVRAAVVLPDTDAALIEMARDLADAIDVSDTEWQTMLPVED